MSRWRREAHRVIALTVRAAPPGTTPEQLRELVDDAYPFGQRQYLPYKQWLIARREAFALLGIQSPAEIARTAKQRAADEAAIEASPLLQACRELERERAAGPPVPVQPDSPQLGGGDQ